MANLRQTILVRTDLGLPEGLLTAQVAHIHMESFRYKMSEGKNNLTGDELEWLKDPYIFVHGVPNKEYLDFFMGQAKQYNVPRTEWRDTIYLNCGSDTVPFADVVVGCALGPCDSDRIKLVIGELPLLP